MKTNYILIDLENVSPSNLEHLVDEPIKVLVFVGAAQKSIPFELAKSLQPLGAKAQYLKIGGSGKNALDFHIAYHLGEIAIQDPGSHCHIISKDTGFDPLVAYLNKEKKLVVHRSPDLLTLPILQCALAQTIAQKVELILQTLLLTSQNRPSKETKLRNAINARFLKRLDTITLDAIVDNLQDRGTLKLEQGKVLYPTPPVSIPGSN